MQRCELNLVNKLCALGQIESYSSDRGKKNTIHSIYDAFDVVNVNEQLVKDIYSILEDLKIKPKIDEVCTKLLYFNCMYFVMFVVHSQFLEIC